MGRSLTAGRQTPTTVTAHICCSCCCNNIKYTYTYNLPRAAPRWEVVQGLWRRSPSFPLPKEQANELRVLNEATNQKKGSRCAYKYVHVRTNTCIKQVFVCVCVRVSHSKKTHVSILICLNSYCLIKSKY